MVGTKTELRPRIADGLPSRVLGGGALLLAAGATVLTVVAYWLPIFQVGAFVYTMIDSYRGGDQFLTAAALPMALGVSILVVDRRRWWPVALTAAVVVTLARVEHLAEAAWRREHPEQFGSPFELRGGFLVAVLSVVAGAVLFAILIRWLWCAPPDRRGDRLSDVARALAAIGLLLAVAGQLAESSTAHLWQLPGGRRSVGGGS